VSVSLSLSLSLSLSPSVVTTKTGTNKHLSDSTCSGGSHHPPPIPPHPHRLFPLTLKKQTRTHIAKLPFEDIDISLQ